jgi:hypothetical protein
MHEKLKDFEGNCNKIEEVIKNHYTFMMIKIRENSSVK